MTTRAKEIDSIMNSCFKDDLVFVAFQDSDLEYMTEDEYLEFKNMMVESRELSRKICKMLSTAQERNTIKIEPA